MEPFIGYIYLITDFKHNKIYIGRKNGHPSKTKYYYGSGKIIKSIKKKYGTYFLHKRIIGIVNTSFEDLKKAEEECITFYNSCNPLIGYNLVKENKGTMGYHHTEDSKRKIKESNKAQIPWNKGKSGIYSEESKKQRSESNKGKKRSSETRLKISKACKGRIPWNKNKPMSEETKLKISKSIQKLNYATDK